MNIVYTEKNRKEEKKKKDVKMFIPLAAENLGFMKTNSKCVQQNLIHDA